MSRFDLSYLYQKTFGQVGIPFIMPISPKFGVVKHPKLAIDDDVPNRISGQQYSFDTVEESEAAKTSLMGAPIHLPLTIDGFEFPDEPLISIRGGKKIIETQMDGEEGTFKELYSTKDWSITIKGFLINEKEDQRLPTKLIRELRKIIEKKQSLECQNTLLSLFNIDRLAIYDYDFPSVTGMIEVQPFTLKCKSDKLFDLELKNPA